MSVSLVCLVFSGKCICMSHKSTIVNVLGVSGLLLVINICPGIMKALQHIHTSFFDITCGLYTSTNQWWISTRATLTTCKNQITLYTLKFGHISSRPAIFQLNVQQYNMHTLPSCCIILRWFTNASYMVKPDVRWCCSTAGMLFLNFFKLSHIQTRHIMTCDLPAQVVYAGP